ncbi:hypothetical protein [Streptomyces olivaceus]|uniref:hypothetical protein n=1 Tax=Streptomyces olivaceus TaxID=47716 RepID=UPI0036CFE8E1
MDVRFRANDGCLPNPPTSAARIREQSHKPADRETDSTVPSADAQDTERDQEQKAPPASASAPSAAPEPSSAAPSAPASSDNPAPAKDSASPVGAAMAWTATGVVAAALVGTLAVRRRRQQHRRRPGRRIAMPKGRAAAEQALWFVRECPIDGGSDDQGDA